MRMPMEVNTSLPEGAFNRTTCESAQPYAVRYIAPCPQSLTVVLVRLLLSLRSTKLVDLSEAGSDMTIRRGCITPSPRLPIRTTC